MNYWFYPKKQFNIFHIFSQFRRYFLRFGRFILLSLITLILLTTWSAWSQQPVTVRFLVQAAEASDLQPLVEGFNQKHPKINLEIVTGPANTNLIEDLYTSAFLLGDSPYDLVYMDIVWVQKFAAAGWLKDLSESVNSEQLKPYLDSVIQGGSYQEKLYRMPFRADGGMLYYRTDLLKKIGANPPETFEELIQTSKTLQQQDLVPWGYVWQGKQYEGLSAMFVEVLEGYGGFWINPDTQTVGLDQPEAIQAVEFLRQTITEGVSPEDVTTYSEEETRLLFQSGKVAFLRNWPYVYALANESEIAGEFAIKPMLHIPSLNSGACLGGWGFGISQSSPHQSAAWEVIQYFDRVDVQRQFFLKTGYVPARKGLFTDAELVAKYTHFPKLLNVIENAVLRPPIPQYAQASDILQRYLSAALTGRKTPEAAMKAAASETRSLLDIQS
ncbi:MAG: ABC transporter substrate-binding protein [Microcoleaceae cyanobacterium]